MEPEYPFEWAGVYALEAGTSTLQLDAGPDAAMNLALVPLPGADEAAFEGVPCVRGQATERCLATGGGANVTVWDCAGPKGPEDTRPAELKLHEAPLSALAYQRAGAVLASGGQDGRVALWSLARNRRPQALCGFNSAVTQLVWAPDDRTLAVGTAEGQLAALALPEQPGHASAP